MDQLENFKLYMREHHSLPDRKVNIELYRWMQIGYKKIHIDVQTEELKNSLEEIRNNDEFSKYFVVDVENKRNELNRLMDFITENKRKPKNKSDNRYEHKLCKIWRIFRDSRDLHLYTNRDEVDKMFKEFMENPDYNVYYLRSTQKWLVKLEELKEYIIDNEKLPENGKLEFWYTYQKRKCKLNNLTYNIDIINMWNEFRRSSLHKSVRV
jgi:hypothetical protein